MVKGVRKKIGERLIEAGLITRDQLEKALEFQRQHGGRIGNILIELGFITEKGLLNFLSRESGIQPILLTEKSIDPSVLKLIPSKFVVMHNVIPVQFIEKDGKKTLAVAVSDPMNLEILDDLRFLSGMEITPILASDRAIWRAIEFFYFGVKREEPSPETFHGTETGPIVEGKQEMGLYGIQRRIDRIERALKHMGELLYEKGLISEKDYTSILEALYIED